MILHKKAFRVFPPDFEPEEVDHPIYVDADVPTKKQAGAAKYTAMTYDENWWSWKALRWKEKDLYLEIIDPILEGLSESQVRKMRHAFGVTKTGRTNRNYYHSDRDEDWEELVRMGLATIDELSGNWVCEIIYRLSERGQQAIMTMVPRTKREILTS